MRKRAINHRDQTTDTRGRREQPWVQHIRTPLSPASVLIMGVVTLVLTVMILACSACTTQSAIRTETDNFTVGESVTLVVKSLSGRIQVDAGSDNMVSIRAELRDVRRIKYEAIRSGDEVIVTAEKTGTWWFPAGNTRADIYVTTPANTALRLETRNGRIEVRGTGKGGILNTSNGTIVLTDVKGDFEATTSNGAVEIDNIEGSAFLRSSNGKITLKEATGQFNAKTTNGDVSFSGHMTPGGSNRLVTTNGRVEVELTGAASLSIDASTSNGQIKHPDVPILTTVAKTDHVVGTIGAGEADLYIETSNGDVVIK